MSIDQLLRQLTQVSERLESAPDDDPKFELNLLMLRLKMQVIAGTFDPLVELETLGVADVERLNSLTAEVCQAIADEQRRSRIVLQITSIAKIALKAAGVPLPF